MRRQVVEMLDFPERSGGGARRVRDLAGGQRFIARLHNLLNVNLRTRWLEGDAVGRRK